MSADTQRKEAELFHRWMCGDEAAVELLSVLSHASQLADDLADEELPAQRKEAMVAELLYCAFVATPKNTFFQQYMPQLLQHLATTVVYWRRSNDFTRNPSDEAAHFSHVDRFALEHLAVSMAEILGGYAHACQVSHEIFSYYHSDEGEHSIAVFRKEGTQ